MNIIIIGAGPSGMMCAIKAKNENNNVTIIEKNDKAGKKLLLTGSGRCNYANEVVNEVCYFTENSDLVSKIINSNEIDLMHKELESIGIYPDIINGYYYPYSHNSASVNNLLIAKCKSKGINFIFNEEVNDIKKISTGFKINNKYECEKLVIACGGKSYPKTGSDGNLYPNLENIGIKFIKMYPCLTQIKTDPIKELSGVRLNAKVSLFDNDKLISCETGELQFIDYGVSGICVFNLSGYVKDNSNLTIKINFLPFTNDAGSFIEERMKLLENLSLINAFESIINYKVLKYIFKKTNISETARYKSLTENEKKLLREYLTSFTLKVYGTNDYDKAQVTMGGVPLTDINISTMESNIVKNLYLIGEILDLTGKCGGYNLMQCFITGLIAGRNINDKS